MLALRLRATRPATVIRAVIRSAAAPVPTQSGVSGTSESGVCGVTAAITSSETSVPARASRTIARGGAAAGTAPRNASGSRHHARVIAASAVETSSPWALPRSMADVHAAYAESAASAEGGSCDAGCITGHPHASSGCVQSLPEARARRRRVQRAPARGIARRAAAPARGACTAPATPRRLSAIAGQWRTQPHGILMTAGMRRSRRPASGR